jgi:hypothetical protein
LYSEGWNHKNGVFMSGLRVIWSNAKPSNEVLKTVEDLRLSDPKHPPEHAFYWEKNVRKL